MEKAPRRFRRIAILLLLLLAAGAVSLQRRQPQPETVLTDAAQREAYLALRGWRVGEPEISQVTLPVSWDTPAGQCWLQLQNTQGLHPEACGGRSGLRYVYPVTGQADTYAELLLVDDRLVGAQVYSTATQLMRAAR